jgi:drug/metabolite transporter (DMT)-like permease
MTERRTAPADRSLGELFAELTQETTTLVRQEVQLATTEMSRKAAEVGKDVGYLVAGAAVAYAGLLALVAAIIIIVAHALPWWASALLVGLVVTGIGAYLVYMGLQNLKQTDLAPRQTIEALKETAP